MNEHTKRDILSYIDNVSLFLVGITFIALPLLFSISFSDSFAIPKQLLVGIATIASFIVLSARMIVEERIRLRTTPFDLPVILFGFIVFLSAIFAVNRSDSLISYIPLLFALLFFFVITNTARTRTSITFAIGSLVLGTTIATVVSVLSFFKIYILPFAYTHSQNFTPFGSLLDQAIFIAIVLPLAGYIAWPVISPFFSSKSSNNIFGKERSSSLSPVSVAATVASAILAVGLLISVYMLLTTQKPIILPFVTGFQTGLAAISQDAGRILQGFLLGSGYGTYMTDFTRFKQPLYNSNPSLWSFTFFRSSSLILELLATTGFLGLLSFLFIIYRVIKEKTFFLPIFIAIAAAFLLPMSFVLQLLVFIVLAVFAALRAQQNPSRYSDLEFYLVTLKHGLILAQPEGERAPHDPVNTRYGKILPALFVVFILGLVGYISFLSSGFILSDMTFQKSLVAASQNNVQQTYTLQAKAIQQFPYRDIYHRTFSQTNITIANAIAANQPRSSSPSAEVQQQIINLIQGSINYGRNAVSISPQSALNWNALSGVYRSLIGFGEKAEEFAVLTNRQAVALDPNNPQQYIALGGIYYQLGIWDEAIRQFSVATNLKNDYSNAYYNLGHAYESKGDEASLRNALQAYQYVDSLTVNDKVSNDKIKAEIQALQQKLSGQTANQQAVNMKQNSELTVNEPTAKLPERDPRAEIQAPPKTAVTPAPSPTVTPTSTPEPTLAQ